MDTRTIPYSEDQQTLTARSCSNVQSNTNGSLIKRTGCQPYSFDLPAGTYTSIFGYDDPSTPLIVVSDGINFYRIAVGGHAVLIGSPGSSTTNRWEITRSQQVGSVGPIYMMNGVDAPQYWNGSSIANWTATTGTLQNGKYMVQAGNRIWVAGVASTPMRVYFSDLIPANNGPVTWPAQNVAVFDEQDGNPITGLGKVGPFILVAKQRKLYVITDMNTGDARRLSDNVGCVAHRSIVESPAGTFFLSEDRGVYLTNGSTLKPISDQIQPTLDGLTAKTTAAGAYFKGHYYLSLDQSANGTNDLTLDYDTLLNSWWSHSFGSNQFTVWHPAGYDQTGLFDVAGNRSTVRQCFAPGVYIDNGANNIAWSWKGAWQSPTFYRRRRFPTSWFRKNFRQLRVEGSGTVDLSFAYDFQANDAVKQRNIFSGNVRDVGIYRAYSFGVHNAVSAIFSATSSTADQVNSFTWKITDRTDGIGT